MYGFGSSPLELLACQAMVEGLIYTDEFTYSCTWQAGTQTFLPATGERTVAIQINSDSDFIAQEYNFSLQRTPDEFVVLPPYYLTITRAGSGRDIMNEAQLIPNFCGNYARGAESLGANNPGRLPISSLYQGNSTVSYRLQNPTSQAPYLAKFSMRGFKVFYQTNAKGVTGNRQAIFHAL